LEPRRPDLESTPDCRDAAQVCDCHDSVRWPTFSTIATGPSARAEAVVVPIDPPTAAVALSHRIDS